MSDITPGLKEGHVFTFGEQRYFVVGINPVIHQVTLQDASSGERQYFDTLKLFELVASGEVEYLDGFGRSPGISVQIVNNPEQSDKSKAEYLYRVEVVKEVDRLLSTGVPAIAAYEIASCLKPNTETASGVRANCPRTVRRWYARYRKHGLPALMPGHARKGRTRTEQSALVNQVISQVVYDNSEKAGLSIVDLHTKVNLRLSNMPEWTEAKRVSYAQVRNVLIQMPWAVRHAHKFEPKFRRAILSFGVESYRVDYPLERVEMDYCKLPIFALFGPGRKAVEVWAAVAIDIATGLPLAIELFMRPPNAMDALQTVRSACYGLDEDQFNRAGIQNKLRVMGAINEIVVDNGSEFRNQSFTNLVQLGFKVTFTPSYSPYRKPFVERAIRSLKTFVSGLPGSTVNQANRSEPDIDRGLREACLTVDQLQSMIDAFVFDDYAQRNMARHELSAALLDDFAGLTPTQRMKKKLSEMTLLPPPAEEQFRLARMIRTERTLQKSGIEYETLVYSSQELRELFYEIGISTKSKRVNDKLEIYVDPYDVRSIHVVHPLGKKRIPAYLKQDLGMAMTLEHFKEARDYARDHFHSEDGQAIMRAFRIRIMGEIEQLENKGKLSRSDKKATRKTASSISKTKSALEQPALEPKDVVKEPALPPLSEQPAALDPALVFTPVEVRVRPVR